MDQAGKIPLHKCSLPEAKILADLYGISSDLHLVMNFLTKWLSTQDDDVVSCALFSAGLITYRRCFNAGVRNGLCRDDVVAIGNGADELHDYLMTQASKLIAHSVNPFERTDVGIGVEHGKVVAVGTMSARLVLFDDAGMKQWGSLVKRIGNTIVNPRIDAARAAVLAAAEARPIAEITSQPTVRYSAPPPEQAGHRRV
jgi:hypothetical protein